MYQIDATTPGGLVVAFSIGFLPVKGHHFSFWFNGGEELLQTGAVLRTVNPDGSLSDRAYMRLEHRMCMLPGH